MTRNPEEMAVEIYKNFSKTNIFHLGFFSKYRTINVYVRHIFIISCLAFFFFKLSPLKSS